MNPHRRTCPIFEMCIVTSTTHVPYTIICFWLHQIHKQSHTYLIIFYIQIFCTSILRKESILKRDKISLLWWKTGFWMIIWPIWYGDHPCYSGKPVTNSLTYCVFVKLIKWPPRSPLNYIKNNLKKYNRKYDFKIQTIKTYSFGKRWVLSCFFKTLTLGAWRTRMGGHSITWGQWLRTHFQQ